MCILWKLCWLVCSRQCRLAEPTAWLRVAPHYTQDATTQDPSDQCSRFLVLLSNYYTFTFNFLFYNSKKSSLMIKSSFSCKRLLELTVFSEPYVFIMRRGRRKIYMEKVARFPQSNCQVPCFTTRFPLTSDTLG